MTDPIGALLAAPPPQLSDDAMRDLAARHYDLTGGETGSQIAAQIAARSWQATRLTSERDLNLLLRSGAGRAFVLKLSNPAEDPVGIEGQTRALQHLAAKAPDLPVPRVVLARDGRAMVPVASGGQFRVLTYLEGVPLHRAVRGAAQRRAVGGVLAELDMALKDLPANAREGPEPGLLWDLQQAARLAPLIPALTDPQIRDWAQAALQRFERRLQPALAALPRQTIHADFNPHNLLVDPDAPDRITGILDFGDMVRAPRICDVAVAASYQLRPDAPLPSLGDFLEGCQSVSPLTPAEIDLLPDLIVLRMVATLAISSWRAARQPQNAPYIRRNAAGAEAGLRAMADLPPEEARRHLTAVCRKDAG